MSGWSPPAKKTRSTQRRAFSMPGTGLRAGDDDDVAGGHADDQLTGDRALQPGPEIAGEQQARFETLEREHQGGWLAVELGPGGEDLEVLERGATQDPRTPAHLFKIGMGDDTPSELRAERVDDAKVRRRTRPAPRPGPPDPDPPEQGGE